MVDSNASNIMAARWKQADNGYWNYCSIMALIVTGSLVLGAFYGYLIQNVWLFVLVFFIGPIVIGYIAFHRTDPVRLMKGCIKRTLQILDYNRSNPSEMDNLAVNLKRGARIGSFGLGLGVGVATNLLLMNPRNPIRQELIKLMQRYLKGKITPDRFIRGTELGF